MKSALRWIAISALFVLPFLALYVADNSFFPFITGKNFAFRILIEIALCAWVALAFIDRSYRPQRSWTLLIYAAFAAWLFIANLLAVNSHKALWSNFERMDGWVTVIHVFAFFLVAGTMFVRDGLWRRWWMAFVGSATLVSLFGLMQSFCNLKSCGVPGAMFAIHQSADRLDATLGNAEYLAGFLVFGIAAAVWLAYKTEKQNVFTRYALLASAALQLVVLFGSGTRGTLIALIGAVGIGSVLWILTAEQKNRRAGIAGLAAVVVLVGGLYLARGTSFVTERPNLNRLATAFNLKKELEVRFTIWDMALEGIKERPITGWGQEGYNYVFNQNYRPSLYAQEAYFDRAHNLFLDWTIAGGFPAVALFILIIVSGLLAFWRDGSRSRGERIILVSTLTAYCIQGLVVFDNLFTYLPLAALLGMAHASSMKPIRSLEKAPEANTDGSMATAAGVALVVAIALIFLVNVPSMRASSDLIQALTPSNTPAARLGAFKQAYADGSFASQEISEQLVQFAASTSQDPKVSEELKSEIATYAITQFAAEVSRAPQDARLRLQYGMLLRTFGLMEEAKVQTAAARALSPDKQIIIFEQASQASQAGDTSGAVALFTEAYELDRRFDQAAAYVAAGHILNNDTPAGKKVLQDHFGTTTPDQQALIPAYYAVRDYPNLIAQLRVRDAANGNATTGYQIAAALAESRNISAAIEQTRLTIAKYPESSAQGQSILLQLGVK